MPTEDPGHDLSGAVDDAIAACGGDARAAVLALLIMVDHLEAELDQRDAELARLAEDVSRGFTRGHWQRQPLAKEADG